MGKKFKKVVFKMNVLTLIFSVLFSSFFSFPIGVYAQTTYVGKITGEDVRLRSKPTTKKENGKSNILLELDEGDSITVLSTNKIAGAKGDCEAGWYQVSYENITGYMCSTYVQINGYDKYDRPWTSPKKAIMGGAKFIAGSYISRGQFTSYLKKFNVNPDGYYDMYNHLYMSNIAAPSSEAITSYSAYQKNGLFDLPLVFNIPIYEEMKDSYDRPGGNLVKVEKQTTITDQAFENELDKQGFPKSYKEPLRALHAKHPNWTFVAMKTDANFSEAMYAFKYIGAIQGGEKYYMLENGKPVQAGNDVGWYVPNNATTSYYLDPRNFLTEKYILQFESLEYSSNYTAEVVQSVLKNTFMNGMSILDNQAYASIFVEAGREANVSPVYLASLARQESGTSSGTNTNGKQFEYEGTTYQGLYNFFNIGANSSASSPVKAGLVYASGGVCTICSFDGNTNSGNSSDNSNNNSNVVPVETKKLESYIKEAGYKIDGNFVKGFKVGDSIESIKKDLKNENITIRADEKIVSTGDVIRLNDESYTIVIYGDLTGDGKINSADLLKMRQYLIGKASLSGPYKESAHLANEDKINSADLLKMRQYLLGKSKISQS